MAVVVTASRGFGGLQGRLIKGCLINGRLINGRLIKGCLVSSALLACSGGPARPEPEVDCSVEDDYELSILQPMEGTTASWYSYGDTTPGATNSVGLQPIPAGRCESTAALVIRSRGYHDWGSGFGEYQTAMAPVDATGYEGVSFWARAEGFGTSSGFLLTVGDRKTSPAGMVCVEPTTEDLVSGEYTYNQQGMIVPVGTRLTGTNDCGNSFQVAVFAHREWYLHRVPFESLVQMANPSRSPTGIDRTGLYLFGLAVPKDSNLDLWIDDLGLYRHRAPDGAAPAQAAQAAP
ncbi:MAG: hypothetical protein ABI895_15650 [Deltaproteobacteria bacterium]